MIIEFYRKFHRQRFVDFSTLIGIESIYSAFRIQHFACKSLDCEPA